MTSLNLSLILAACIICSTSFICNASPASVPDSVIAECQRGLKEKGDAIVSCITKEFTEAEMNETRRMYNHTECIKCKHFCRKEQALLDCIRNGTATLKDVSNKSKQMVPFLGQLIERIITSICENEDVFLNVTKEEDKECYRDSWKECKVDLDYIDELESVAFCDYEITENDPNTLQCTCQKITESIECIEKSVKSCSNAVQNFVHVLTSNSRIEELCADSDKEEKHQMIAITINYGQ
ncbi:uncharacterized protein [Hetaerina americana]|uniref:uncharacterized protein n=1 Tax=Hetaerina americana TaxID=62018 RepID=UPI003A7F4234